MSVVSQILVTQILKISSICSLTCSTLSCLNLNDCRICIVLYEPKDNDQHNYQHCDDDAPYQALVTSTCLFQLFIQLLVSLLYVVFGEGHIFMNDV